jgi:hypothetical protein
MELKHESCKKRLRNFDVNRNFFGGEFSVNFADGIFMMMDLIWISGWGFFDLIWV